MNQDNKQHLVELPVLWSQMDANGHLNNGTYQYFFDEARMQALDARGFSIKSMRESGIGPVIIKAQFEYFLPVPHPETVIITTGFRIRTKVRGIVDQTMFRKSDEKKVCEAQFEAIFFDFRKQKPWKLPDWFQ